MGMPPSCNCFCGSEDGGSSSSSSGIIETCSACGIAPVTFSLSATLPNGADPSPCCSNYEGPVLLTYSTGCTWQSSTKAMYHYADAFGVKQCYTPVGQPNLKPMYTLTIALSAGNLVYTITQTYYTYSLGVSPATKHVATFSGSFGTGNCLTQRTAAFSSTTSGTSDSISNGVGPSSVLVPPCGQNYSSGDTSVTLSAI